MAVISEESADAQYVFIGLRPRQADEPPEKYAEYFRRMREETISLRSAVFTLAAEGVDFKRIYAY
jgi:adenosine deaminase